MLGFNRLGQKKRWGVKEECVPVGLTGPRAWHTEKFVVELRKDFLAGRQKYVYESKTYDKIEYWLNFLEWREDEGWPDELVEICLDLIDDIDDLNAELTPTKDQTRELEHKLCPHWHWVRHSGYLSIWIDL